MGLHAALTGRMGYAAALVDPTLQFWQKRGVL
jgi:hypothetical protein